MRILGIDPGLSLTGYGCVELDAQPSVLSPQPSVLSPHPSVLRPASSVLSSEPRLIEAGVLRLKNKSPMPFRLAQLYDDLCQLLEELKPDLMVVEKLFSHYKHVRTGILMGHARGVVLLAGQVRGIEIDELAVTEIKRAITGRGHASKHQVQRAIMTQCGLAEPPEPPDVADAIAIALCAARRIGTSALR